MAHELGEHLLTLAENLQDSGLLCTGPSMQGETLHYLGEFAQAPRTHEQGLLFTTPSSPALMPFSMGLTQEWAASLMRPLPCGCLATRTKP